jgi:AbrB family looped-hinge helix DNA binding protein
MMHLKMSARGEIVIPKKIREYLGLSPQKSVVLEIKDDSVLLRPSADEELMKRWEARAKRLNIDTSHWVMGDKLYEEGF